MTVCIFIELLCIIIPCKYTVHIDTIVEEYYATKII